jgi:hypothetical protein
MRFGSTGTLIATLSLLLSLHAAPSLAQSDQPMTGGGPIDLGISDDDTAAIDAARVEAVRNAAALGVPVAPAAVPGTLFQYPLRSTTTASGLEEIGISNYVDRNAAVGPIQDFSCGNRTYDGHHGIDNFLTPFSWNVMDRKEVQVVAALPGVIVDKHDGEFDRQCTLDPANPPPANFVIIRHDNGLLGFYWHLKNGTVTTKAVGARVSLGEVIGFVGSSGFSSGPHLHFEVQTASGTVIEPFAGACNPGATHWAEQPRTVDSTIIRIATHSIPPPSAGNCDNPNPGYATRFVRGKIVWAAAYLRDQTPTKTAVVSILRPNGTVATSFTSGAPASGIFVAAYWFTGYTLPADAPAGEWKVKVTYAGRTNYQSFIVQSAAPLATTISAVVATPVRTVATNKVTNFNVTITNKTANRAVGCRLSLAPPIVADVIFRQTNSAGTPVGLVNNTFAVLPNGTAKIVLTVVPRAGFRAVSAEFPLVAKCLNSAAAAFSRTTTLITLTGP